MATTKELRRKRIHSGVRSKIYGTTERPRLSVFRSNKLIYAQIIDDNKGTTIASASSGQIKDNGVVRVELSKQVGQKVAEMALAKGVSEVVFDRGGYLYHGRVKALAEGAREGGLKF